VISLHNNLSPWALQYKAGRKRIALWLYERENLAKADVIHATSDSELEEIRGLGLCQPIALIPLGFVGPVYGSKKAQAYASAELFVLPSRSENFGLTVLEALGNGVPVVASRETPWSALVIAAADGG